MLKIITGKSKVVMLALCFAVFILYQISCTKSSEDKLMEQNSTPVCDTVNMHYSADVIPIIQANCYSCHGNGNEEGGVILDNYQSIKSEATSGLLEGAITHAAGLTPMPLNEPQLSSCNINKIISWINNGAQNN